LNCHAPCEPSEAVGTLPCRERRAASLLPLLLLPLLLLLLLLRFAAVISASL
jgi:hypothetical protein